MEKRPLDVAVISDVRLGTYGCRAKELVNYLKSISPNILILNGDIIDGWVSACKTEHRLQYQGLRRIPDGSLRQLRQRSLDGR